MDQDSDMTRFAHYGITTPEDEAEAETMQDETVTANSYLQNRLKELRAEYFLFKDLASQTVESAWRLGQILFDIQANTAHGEFLLLLSAEFPEWSYRSVYRFINLYQSFKFDTVSNLNAGLKALYLLSAPSTPDEARLEAITRSENGETITYKTASEIVGNWNKPTLKEFEAVQERQFIETQWNLYGKNPYDEKDEHLDAALEDESKSVCPECGQVYDGPTCPDCAPILQNGMSQPMGVFMSHKAIEWYTPPEYIEAARQVMGAIDLDPATAPIPQAWIKATIFYTILDNGLIQPWQGRVWLNPPYSTTDGQSNQEIWSQKLIKEYESGQVTEAILLVKASLGYNWFDRLFDTYPVCFKRGLISFINSDRESGPAKLGSAFFYLGPNLARFVTVFSRFGRIVAPESVTTYGY